MNDIAQRLLRAVRTRNTEELERIASEGVAPFAEYGDGERTALDLAIDERCTPEALLLVRAGALASGRRDSSLLHRAVWNDALALALMDAGFDPAERSALYGNDSAYSCAESGSPRLLCELVARGADTETRSFGATPLHVASRPARDDMVAALIDLGCNVHATNARGESALHELAQWSSNRHFWCLVDRAGTPEQTAAIGRTAAALTGAGLAVDERDNDGATPFLTAARWLNHDAMISLLRLGADPCAVDANGRGAAHYMVLGGAGGQHWITTVEGGDGGLAAITHALRHLRSLGIDLDRADHGGQTAMHLAVGAASDIAMHALIALGADPGAKDNSGMTPLDTLARQRRRWRIRRLPLLQAAAARHVLVTAGGLRQSSHAAPR